MPVVELRSVTHTYHPGTPYEKKALEDVSFSCGKGEAIGIIGANGSGKSTLLQHLNGILAPTAGEVIVLGRNVSHKNVRDTLWRKVGLLFQFPERQVFEATVYDEIAYGPRNMGSAADDIRRRVCRALEILGLPETLLFLSPFCLSGGTLRRVAMASILAMEPEILILDEPTAGLDPEAAALVVDAVDRMKREEGVTVIWVSHGLDELLRIADRIAVLDAGKLRAWGAPREVLAMDAVREYAGLMPEYLRVLFDLKARGWDIDTGMLSPEEAAEEIFRAMGVRT